MYRYLNGLKQDLKSDTLNIINYNIRRVFRRSPTNEIIIIIYSLEIRNRFNSFATRQRPTKNRATYSAAQ